jgi:hypothetical protein
MTKAQSPVAQPQFQPRCSRNQLNTPHGYHLQSTLVPTPQSQIPSCFHLPSPVFLLPSSFSRLPSPISVRNIQLYHNLLPSTSHRTNPTRQATENEVSDHPPHPHRPPHSHRHGEKVLQSPIPVRYVTYPFLPPSNPPLHTIQTNTTQASEQVTITTTAPSLSPYTPRPSGPAARPSTASKRAKRA